MNMQKVQPVNSPQTAFALVQDVVRAVTDTAAIRRFPVGGSLAAVVLFFGNGASNTTFSCRIYGEYPVLNGAEESVRFLLGTAACTLGTNAGATGGVAIPAGDEIVDGIVWTASAFLTAAEAAFGEGSSGCSNPLDDTQAALFLPCLARCSNLVFEYDMTGATDGNALVALAPI